MNNNAKPVLAGVVALAVCAAGWILLPRLQPAERSVATQASTQAEYARRLLDGYLNSLTYLDLVNRQLDETGMQVDADAFTEQMEKEFERIHSEEFWAAYPPREDVGDGNFREKRPSYGNVPGEARTGLAALAKHSSENEALLKEAARAVDNALAVTVADKSARSHAEAARLKGAILYYQGIARLLEARLSRSGLHQVREELIQSIVDAVDAKAVQGLTAGSAIDVKIARLQADIDAVAQSQQEERKELAGVNSRVADIELRLAAAVQRRDKALEAMRQMKNKGLDFSDPQGGARFEREYLALDNAYRKADRDAKALRHGTYPNARIDHTGDYLFGKYVEEGTETPAIDFGLTHFRNEQAVLNARVNRRDDALAQMQEDLAQLAATRELYLAREAAAADTLKRIASEAQEIVDRINKRVEETLAIEEEALDHFDQSGRQMQNASRNADQWVAKAGEKTRELGESGKKASAYSARLDDRWQKGFAMASEADAILASAFVFHDRYNGYQLDAEVFRDAADLLGSLQGADPQQAQEAAEAAREQGVEYIKTAMDTLKKAHQPCEQNWNVATQAAGTMYMLVLLGHEDYAADTISAYRTAIQGRETDAAAAVFASRLATLESR